MQIQVHVYKIGSKIIGGSLYGSILQSIVLFSLGCCQMEILPWYNIQYEFRCGTDVREAELRQKPEETSNIIAPACCNDLKKN